ncbi:hypothetical protein MmazTMA_08770 [Methanosarcina mazei]|jgi:hypothetical protein|nr:hypothetical protein MmazTMA_08770 [Methanosarcina mazei]
MAKKQSNWGMSVIRLSDDFPFPLSLLSGFIFLFGPVFSTLISVFI